MTTLEKMARAQCARDALKWTGVSNPTHVENLWRDNFADYLADTRAALEALREPSEGMLRAAWENESGVTEIWECGKQLERLKRDYQSMIDAILEGQ